MAMALVAALTMTVYKGYKGYKGYQNMRMRAHSIAAPGVQASHTYAIGDEAGADGWQAIAAPPGRGPGEALP